MQMVLMQRVLMQRVLMQEKSIAARQTNPSVIQDRPVRDPD
jgi:hypothetical protein